MLFIVTNLYIFKTKKKNIASLTCGSYKINCFVGKNGIGRKSREGDKITPKGEYKILKIFYRGDRINICKTRIPSKKIEKNSFWCADSKSDFYNSFCNKANNPLYERLYREDNLYDIVVSCDFNINPIEKYKGSAIFIHCSNNNTMFTEGCIALEKKYFIKILKFISPISKLIIY